jgi:hypothetical protein
VEDTLIEIGSKWSKKWKRRSEARENESLDEKIEENRLTRNMDCRKLRKKKMPPMNTLEHFVRKKEGQAGEAQNMWIRLT